MSVLLSAWLSVCQSFCDTKSKRKRKHESKHKRKSNGKGKSKRNSTCNSKGTCKRQYDEGYEANNDIAALGDLGGDVAVLSAGDTDSKVHFEDNGVKAQLSLPNAATAHTSTRCSTYML